MIGRSFLALAIPFVPAYLLVRAASGRASRPAEGVVQLLLCLGVAPGISSCTYFLWLAKPVPALPGLAAFEAILFFILCAAPFCFPGSRRALVAVMPFGKAGPSVSSLPRRERAPAWLLVCFGLVTAMAVCAFVMVVSNKLHGSNDAYAVWNLRARFLFRGGDHWTDGFSPLIRWSNPDYPLLLSATVARWWAYIRSDTILVPQLVAFFFYLATAVLLVSAVSTLRSVRQGLVAGLFLFSTSFFTRLGGSQYADVPIGLFMLAAMVAFSLGDGDRERSPAAYTLAGVFAGCAAWTKNEGMLFVVAVFVARLVSAALAGAEGRKGLIREIAFFCAGLAPILAVLAFFKLAYAPSNDLFRDQGAGPVLARITDPHRYAMIVEAFLNEIVRWGSGLFPILLVYALFTGTRHDSRHLRLIVTCATVLVVMFCGHFCVYLCTPNDLAWMLGGSLERLLLQLWPTFLFMLFLVLRPPEGRWRKAQHRAKNEGLSRVSKAPRPPNAA